MSGLEVIPICPLDVAIFFEKGWLTNENQDDENQDDENQDDENQDESDYESDRESEFIDKNEKSHRVFIRSCPGDGSCFFWAIKEALNLPESVSEIRKIYADSLDDLFDKISGGEIANVYKKEKIRYEILNTTVDEYILPFTTTLFCVNVIVLTYDPKKNILTKSDIVDRSKVVPFADKCATVDTIILSFTRGNPIGHYEVVYALRNKEERILFPSTDTLVRAIRMRH